MADPKLFHLKKIVITRDHKVMGIFALFLGGFVGPNIMGLSEEATGNPSSGLWVVVGLLVLGAVLAMFLRQGHETSGRARAETLEEAR